MNLFKVDKNLWSHPKKSYVKHIQNIADSFDDEAHRVSANFHDIGKLSDEFQRYIRKQTDKKTTHAIEGGYLFPFLIDNIDKDFLSIFFSIVKHHLALSDIKDDVYKYSNEKDNIFEKESWIEKIDVIAKNLNRDSKHSAEEFHELFTMFYNSFSNFSNLDTFFLFKKRYSRLILADKFEAIFSQAYKNIDYFEDDEIKNHLYSLYAIINTKPKNKFRNDAKKVIFDNFEKNKDASIYLIKAPTGIGKTFIAFELALKIAKHTKTKRRIITALPFTSIIDQTHSEYEDIIGKGRVLKYHHLTKYEESQQDEEEQFSQKVFLTDIWQDQFVVTTFNQLLFTFFSNRNRDNVRLETLRDSVIIIDEVQNISRILLQSVAKVFSEFSKRYNIHFIIMSATMPSFKGFLDEAKILSEDSFYSEKKNRYRLHYDKSINTFASLSEKINGIKDKSILCVVNTIEKAKKLFDEIDGVEGKTKFLLTTHQIPLHRKEIIEEIKKALKDGKKITLISTQLIEAGVDLDFEVGFREFAPFGSIIQMAGRVNREGVKGVCDIFVFDFLDVGRGDDAKKLPYHKKDLQAEDVSVWLKTSLEEIDILENLDIYFETLQKETTSVDLVRPMKNLEFETLFKLFNKNFMPNQPWKVSLFVEIREGQFNDFIAKREAIFNEYEDKFEALNRVKDLEKELGLYTISVNRSLIEEELIGGKHKIRELFGRFILPCGSEEYSKYRGFNIELARLEDSVGFENI